MLLAFLVLGIFAWALKAGQLLYAHRVVGVKARRLSFVWDAVDELFPPGMLDDMLADPASDMPFCLCWANENWTRRWDAAEHDLVVGHGNGPGSREKLGLRGKGPTRVITGVRDFTSSDTGRLRLLTPNTTLSRSPLK